MEIQHFSHQHPLAFCSYIDGICSACKDSISGPAYGCNQCQYFLHKSCGELPQVIQYPFHPKHPLTLLATAPYRWRKFACSMCKKRHYAFTYHCSECKFDVDIPCSKIRPSTGDENDEQQIQHFSHRHPLVAVTLYGCTTSFICYVCQRIIVGDLAYACWKCKFVIHKWCYDLPKEIQSRFHPRHSLTLLAKSPYRSKEFYCDACSLKFTSGFTYHCSRCEFDLDIFCSMIKPLLSDNKNSEQRIQHLSHPHPLFKVSVAFNKDDQIFRCSLCKEPKGNLMYVCFKCRYFVHESCAEFPCEIRHPFHPHHLLRLVDKLPNQLRCYACQKECTDLAFQCSECNFSIHFSCALFDPSIQREEHKQKIQHFSHQHPLIPVALLEGRYNFNCSLCDQIIKGSIYVCIKCGFFVHKSCAELPQEILHPFHPAHPLCLLHPPEKKPYCSSCRYRCDGFMFHCAECGFQMHFNCAINTRTIYIDHDYNGPPIQHFAHPHPLIPVNTALFRERCTVCNEGLGATSYACFQCMFFVGKSCCFEFPKETRSLIHQHHPLGILTLSANETRGCKVCGPAFSTRRFVYRCPKCGFILCSECQPLPTIKYELHEHLLVIINEYKGGVTLLCDTCGGQCTKCFVRCVECDMNLHVQCIPPLPITGKHRTHRHFLTLTDPLPEDETNEYYCDACEKERNPKLFVYYCAKCEFTAHIECGLSEAVLSNDEVSSVACRLMDAGMSISDIEEAVNNDSAEEESEEEEAYEEEEEELDFNISELFDEKVREDLDEEGTEYKEEMEEMAVGEEQADQEPYVAAKEEEEANQESDVSADSSELEKEMDGVREEMEALARKLEALQQRKGKKSHVASQPQMKRVG